MTGRTRITWLITVATFSLCSTTVLGLVISVTEGVWPDSWPEALEPYRAEAKTRNCEASTVYEIPFKDRDEFESAWPHVLSLKSEGAPLILVRSPSTYDGSTLDVGVRVLSPPGAAYTSDVDGTSLKPGPPWPESALLPSGELPEYVVMHNGQWVPPSEGETGYVRARQDIILVCDGDIVDLNRIPLPLDTSIVDKRFEATSTPTETK